MYITIYGLGWRRLWNQSIYRLYNNSSCELFISSYHFIITSCELVIPSCQSVIASFVLVISGCEFVISSCQSVVTSCELVMSSCEAVISSYQSVITRCELVISSCQSVITSCDLVISSCELVISCCQSVITSCELAISSYESVSSSCQSVISSSTSCKNETKIKSTYPYCSSLHLVHFYSFWSLERRVYDVTVSYVDIISSPEPLGLWWDYRIGRPLSSVCMCVCMCVNIFKHLLRRNHWADWNQISLGASLEWGNESLFKRSGSHYQNGPAHIW